MMTPRKLAKIAKLLTRGSFAKAAIRHRVAATIEHIPALEAARAATLIDVGANKGQFSLAYRSVNPGGRVIAFEPLDSEAAIYANVFGGIVDVQLLRYALSDEEGTATFHVADRPDSSSLLQLGTGQKEAYDVAESRTITVDVRRLDASVDWDRLPRPILLKIDVQGAELKVLEGGGDLGFIDYIYVELSFVHLYDGQPLKDEVEAYLTARGFALVATYNLSSTERFGPTQADFLFKRTTAPTG